MSSVSFLGILIAIIILSLVVSAYAHYRQQQQRKFQKLSQQLSKSAAHFSELARLIDRHSSKKSIAAELIGMSVKNYQRMLKMQPNSQTIANALQNVSEFAQRLSNGRTEEAMDSLLTSEAEVYQAKRQLNDIEKIFRKMVEQNKLSREAFDQYHQELAWLYLQIEVDFLVHQANRAKEQKWKLKTLAFYQKALNTLKKSPLVDSRKMERIESINELLQKQPDSETKVSTTTKQP